jgi:hypothetical protein
VNEGMGWRNVGNIYTVREMISDIFNREVLTAWKQGIHEKKIKTAAEFFFPILRPIFVFIGNHLVRKYVK